MTKVMVLGASILQIPLIQQVKKNGYHVVVVSPDKNEPGFKYSDYQVYEDVSNEKEILKHAKKHKIVGITTDQTDIPVRTAAYVAEKMGLPGIGYSTACLFTDKFLMREKCKELGIPTLKYKKVNDLNDAIEFFRTLNEPAIIKPIDNQGSKGISKVNNIKELKLKFNEALFYSKSKSVLIEQFVSGREFVVEGMAFNNKFKNLICGDTHYFKLPNVFSATKRIFPSKAEEELVKRIKRLNEKIITSFGLNQGITHSEFIVADNEIYLIETAARGGGVFISSDLISILTGLNTEEFLVNIATGTLKKLPTIKSINKTCCYIAFFLPVGEVVSIEGVENVIKKSYIHRHNLDYLKVGLKTRPYKDKTGRYYLIISANNHVQLSHRIKEVQTELKIKVKTKSGLKGPIWS